MSDILDKMLKETPLKTRLFILFQMQDYNNWVNGEYFGNINKLNKRVNDVLKTVDEWVKDDMPKDEKSEDNYEDERSYDEDKGGTGHGDTSFSDADNGL